MTGEQIVVVLLAILSTFEAIVVLLIKSKMDKVETKVDLLDATIQAQKTTSRTTFPRTE